MKTLIAGIFLCMALVSAAEDRFIVLEKDTTFVASNNVQILLKSGDCFAFVEMKGATAYFEVPNAGLGRVNSDSASLVPANEAVLKRNRESIQRVTQALQFEIPPLMDWAPTDVAEKGRMATLNEPIVKTQDTVMQRVYAMELFAVATHRDDLQREHWTLEVGETFPFLGFIGDMARVGFDNRYMEIPRRDITIISAKEHPEVRETYRQIVTEYKTNLATAEALQRIEQQLEKIHQQQQLDWLNRH